VKNALLQLIQTALNTYLHLDPESPLRLQGLDGKVATIEFLPFHLRFQCVFADAKIRIQTDELLVSDVIICGTPLQLLGMMIAEDKRRFFAEDIRIEGDAELGQHIVDVFDHLDIDWEEYLAKIVGDIPAHQIGCWGRRMVNWVQQTQQILMQDTTEYVQEEIAFSPPREAIAEFFHEVDTLRMDVDRLAAKVQALKE